MDEDNSYENSMLTSKLNSGFFILKRLDELWRDCYKYVRNGMFNDWNMTLDTIWSELGGEYNEESIEQKKFNEINKKLMIATNWISNIKGFTRITTDDKKEKTRQYILLREKELFLRRIQNKQGKGTAYVESDDDYFSLA